MANDATRREGWSEELEELHEESSRSHSVDVWTREAMLSELPPLFKNATVLDVGCSGGYLLEDLAARLPSARLAGIDLVYSGLRKALTTVPRSLILQADACHLPIACDSIDVLLSANLLEHIADDVTALKEFNRVLRPGGRAILVVPMAPGTYDYYDRFLQHQRRYRRGEMAMKATRAGFEVLADFHLCSLIYPAFWVAKKSNRVRFRNLDGTDLKQRVAQDISKTQDSSIFAMACNVERWLLRHHVALPFGIRGLTVVRRI